MHGPKGEVKGKVEDYFQTLYYLISSPPEMSFPDENTQLSAVLNVQKPF
jgi:hypothetical protein